MLLAALTGGIGSGKSTLAAALGRRGAPVVDADRVARQVVEPDGPAYQPLVERFGAGILHPDGTLDRKALAAVAFGDPDALADLNRITHPVIGVEVMARLEALAGCDGPVVLDIPLLNAVTIELYRPSALVVVDTPEEVAVARLVAHRGFAEADARARIAAQSSREDRRALTGLVAHAMVVDNSGAPDRLERAAGEVWDWLAGLEPGGQPVRRPGAT